MPILFFGLTLRWQVKERRLHRGRKCCCGSRSSGTKSTPFRRRLWARRGMCVVVPASARACGKVDCAPNTPLVCACAHGTAPAHTRAHARRTMCPASAKQALAVADRRLRDTGQSTGCPKRSCSHLREAKCGTQRTRTRTITAPTVHGRTAHAPILAEIVHAVTAAPTMRAHDAVVATTLHSWPLAHAPMHGTRCKSLEPLCGACRSDEPRDVHNRRADRFHECAIRRRRL